MKYNRLFSGTFTLLLVISSLFVFGQNHQPCATTEMWEEIVRDNPELRQKAQEDTRTLEQETEAFLNSSARSTRNNKILVPVVFHILHQNGPENISNEQIYDCMRIVNEDFNAENEDLDEVISQFTSRIGNANMEFRLARIDPNGNPTNGINRYNTPETNNPGQGQKINGWPRGSYLNIWVANNIASGNTAAYAILPGDANQVPHLDGIVANHRYVGSIGTSNYSARHTITHEIGHVFNLLHPWGGSNTPGDPSNCNLTDGVHDTPETIGTFGLCDLNQFTCGSLDNVQNIMDYSNCDVMLTQGQIDRMRAAANSNIAERSSLTSSQNADATGITELFELDFSAIRPAICERDTVYLRDESRYDPDSWNWILPGADPQTSQDQNTAAYYWQPGLYDVRLDLTQGSDQRNIIKPNFVQVSSAIGYPMPYDEAFETVDAMPHKDWYALNNSTNFGFEITENNGYQNTQGLVLKNFNNPDHEAEFIVLSPTLDTRVYTSYDLNFKVAYARNSSASSQDRIRIEVSTDCGATWTELYNRLAPFIESTQPVSGEFTPSSTQDWEQNSIENIGANGIGAQTRFRFVVESAGNNNLYLDDINISGSWGNQVQLKSPYNNKINTASDVLLRWQPLGNVDQYEYQVAEDAGFNTIVHSGTNDFISLAPDNEDTEFAASGLEKNKRHYWRVRGIQSGTPGDWSETWAFTVSSTGVSTSDKAKEEKNLKVYPNPARNVLNFSLENSGSEQVEWELRSLSGQRVLSGRTSGAKSGAAGEISVGNLSPGLYIFAVKTSGKTYLEKVVIQ